MLPALVLLALAASARAAIDFGFVALTFDDATESVDIADVRFFLPLARGSRFCFFFVFVFVFWRFLPDAIDRGRVCGRADWRRSFRRCRSLRWRAMRRAPQSRPCRRAPPTTGTFAAGMSGERASPTAAALRRAPQRHHRLERRIARARLS